jgi:hypothetical protein
MASHFSVECIREETNAHESRSHPADDGKRTNERHCGNQDDAEDDAEDDATTTLYAVHGTKGSPPPACPAAYTMNSYVPHEHVVQQGQEILGRRDTPEDRVEPFFRKIG